MECVNVSGKCRACRIKTQKEFQIPIFTTENLQLIFHEATSLEIHENDGLPEVICEDCHKRLLEAHEFRQMCAASTLKFQQIISGDGDSDFEEKYKPLEVVGVPSEEEVKLPDQDVPLVNASKSLVSSEVTKTTKRLKKSKLNLVKDLKGKLLKKGRISKNIPSNDKVQAKDAKHKKESPKKLPVAVKVKIKKQRNADLPKSTPVCELKCKDCGKVYTNKSSLRTHRNTIHRGFEAAKCDICGREFQRHELLRNHMARLHGAKDMLKCTECFRVFRTDEGLVKHMKEWHDPENPKEKPKNHICEFCGKAFACATHLQEHTSTHSGIKPHKCTVCSRDYLTKHQLKVHTMRCHDGIRNHVCTICGAQKATLRELQLHMNQHSEERITCEQCSKTFISHANLNLHVRTVHQGIKAYTCSHCGQSFARPGTLKHHVMTHTGEKPHACEECGKRFIQLTALNSHKRTHSKLK